MKKKGFIFLEIILGIFLLGLISIVALNLLNLTSVFFKKAEENIEIDYIVEMIIENLKSKDEMSTDFLNGLSSGSDSEYPLTEDYKDKYTCDVILTEDNDYLWCFKLKIYKTIDKGRTIYEEFQGSIPK